MSAIGRSFATESFSTLDGPGIRYVLFLQGCMMRCQYCHNRDSWPMDGGQLVTVEQVLDQLRQYRRYFKSSGGGLTVSGGEALLQPEFVRDLFQAAQAEGFHTCLDTNGYCRRIDPCINDLLEATDLVLLDLKQLDDTRHRVLTGVSNRHTLKFARHLESRQQPTWIRHVIVPGFTDDLESARMLSDFVTPMKNVEKIELLPYHEMGKQKWQAIKASYPLEGVKPPQVETLTMIKQHLTDQGLIAQI